MNTKIKLTHNGQEYILEYDRMSVKLLESSGFVLDEFLEKPMSNIELAFTAAFVKNHKKTSQTTIDEIFAGLKDKTGLITMLSKMIRETYDALLEDGSDEGNVEWEVVDLSPKKSHE